MTPTETAAILSQFNAWRRGNLEDQPMPDLRVAIDEALKYEAPKTEGVPE